jgi:hypothetical protein
MSVIQSVIFNKDKWNIKDAKAWLKDHDYKSPKVDETENFFRFRQTRPLKKFNYATKKLGKTGIELIIAQDSTSPRTPFGLYEKETGGAVSADDTKNIISETYKDKPSEKIGNYVLDKDLSTAEAKVYHDPVTNKTIVSNRGTSGAKDWINNGIYALSNDLYKKTGRYKRAKDVQDKTIQKYGKVDTNVGHSQGAIITRNLNDEGKTGEVINVNPASKGETQKDNEYNVRSKKDVVSALSVPANFIKGIFRPSTKRKDKTITVKADTNNVLKEHSGDILNRLDPNQMLGGALPKKDVVKLIDRYLKEHEGTLSGGASKFWQDFKMAGNRKPKK